MPFADTTSGEETYAAGRYMELDPTATGIYVIDFNGAYHPFCYYNAEYDCPFPPAENRLPSRFAPANGCRSTHGVTMNDEVRKSRSGRNLAPLRHPEQGAMNPELHLAPASRTRHPCPSTPSCSTSTE